MPFDDDFVHVARLHVVEASKAEVVDDQQVRREKGSKSPVGRVIRTALQHGLEHAVGTHEEHPSARAARRMAERRSEERLADADRPEQQRVFPAIEESETEQVAHAVAIETHGCFPVEDLQGLLALEAGFCETELEPLVVAPVDLVLKNEFEEVTRWEFRFGRVRDAVRQRRKNSRQSQAFEYRLQ